MTTSAPNRRALSRREVQVAAGIARGHSNAEIASRLCLSTGTVKKHVERMMSATGAPTRAALVAHVYRTGYLEQLKPEPRPPVRLAPREREVLEGLAAGLTNVRISQRLFICPSTTRDTVTRLIQKFQAADRAHVVALAWQQGLLGAGSATKEAA